MGNVVSINRGKFLGDYISRKAVGIVEDGFFLLGVLGTIVVPQVVYCANGGPVSPWGFVVSAEAGVILGLVRYIWPAIAVASIVDTQAAPISQGEWTRLRNLS